MRFPIADVDFYAVMTGNSRPKAGAGGWQFQIVKIAITGLTKFSIADIEIGVNRRSAKLSSTPCLLFLGTLFFLSYSSLLFQMLTVIGRNNL
jgi:hypothetical protein